MINLYERYLKMAWPHLESLLLYELGGGELSAIDGLEKLVKDLPRHLVADPALAELRDAMNVAGYDYGVFITYVLGAWTMIAVSCRKGHIGVEQVRDMLFAWHNG